MKKSAFTLAETLITLAIVGVVAVLSIPVLMEKYNEFVSRTALKKVFSEVSSTLQLMSVNEESFFQSGTQTYSQKYVENPDLIKKYFRVKDGPFFIANNTYWNSDLERNYRGKVQCLNQSTGGCMLVSPGSVFAFSTEENKIIYFVDDYAYHSGVIIDTNGKIGPNRIGYDIWFFVAKANSDNSFTLVPLDSNDCKKNKAGKSCAKYVLENIMYKYPAS